jgi:hypothetical protein
MVSRLISTFRAVRQPAEAGAPTNRDLKDCSDRKGTMPRLGAFLSPLAHFGCTGHWPPSSRRTPLLPHWPLGCRPARLAAGRELGSLSCPIPPSFVLSHNMPVINTTSNGLCWGAFQAPPVPPYGCTGLWSLASRPTPHTLRSLGPPSLPRAEPVPALPTRQEVNMRRNATLSGSVEIFGALDFRCKLL